MKVAKITQPIKAIGTKIKNQRIEKHQAEINKYVNITPGQNGEAYKQIITAQEMLANYAKAKNIKINIYDAATSNGKLIDIAVSKPGNASAVECINADTGMILKAERSNTRMLENKDGLNYESRGKITSEDTFLKNLYRVVENLTE